MENYRGPALGDDSSVMAELDDNNANALGRARPRRHDDEDEGSEFFEDDDLESTVGGPANGNARGHGNAEEEKELPPHACAYVLFGASSFCSY